MATPTTLKIARVLSRLQHALGTGENPPGSNDNFIVQWYNLTVDDIGRGPWCEMTATWAMWTGGAKAIKTGRAYTVWAVQDAIAKKLKSSWHTGTKGMKAGDQVYYDWSASGDWHKVDHTGIVEKILGGGTFYVLEGNTNHDKLERKLRDGKYVVGYVRYDWPALPDDQVLPKPPAPLPKPTLEMRRRVREIQRVLKVDIDGQWGFDTDRRARRMRAAARANFGSPRKVPAKFNISDVQRVVGADVDGVWGPRSYTSLAHWVKDFQRVLGVPADGQWGPKTDNAYWAHRKANFVPR